MLYKEKNETTEVTEKFYLKKIQNTVNHYKKDLFDSLKNNVSFDFLPFFSVISVVLQRPKALEWACYSKFIVAFESLAQ